MRREYLEIVKKQQLKNKTCEEKIIQERKILNKRFQHTVTTQHNTMEHTALTKGKNQNEYK